MRPPHNFSRYFPPAPEFSDCGCRLVSFGMETILPGESYPRQHHPADHLFSYKQGRVLSTYVIQFLISGQGHFETKGTGTATIEAGDAILYFPEVRHRYRPTPDTGWGGWWIEMSGPVVDAWMMSAKFSPKSPVLRRICFDGIRDVLEELAVATSDESLIEPMRLSALVLQLIAATRYATNLELPRSDSMQEVAAVRQLLRERTLEPHVDWEAISAEVGISYSKLRQKFTDAMGVSPGQYHLFLRERLAVSLIRNSDRTISEIADHLGFESNFYFSAFIKKRTGSSPKSLRLDQTKG